MLLVGQPAGVLGFEEVGAGLFVLWAFVKKCRKPKALTELGPMEIDDPALEKYKDQIEEDLKKLD